VKVLTPPTPPDTVDAAMTTFVNQDGGVSTAKAENVRANDHVDGAPFVEWKRITVTPAIQTASEIDLTQGETGEIWFAFYQTPPQPPISLGRIEQLISAGIFVWTGDDTCGNGGHWIGPGHGPVGPGPGTFKVSVGADVIARLSDDQQKQLRAIMSEYPATAQAALTGMTNVLNDINGILSKAQGK
jgi:hypothetical protein